MPISALFDVLLLLLRHLGMIHPSPSFPTGYHSLLFLSFRLLLLLLSSLHSAFLLSVFCLLLPLMFLPSLSPPDHFILLLMLLMLPILPMLPILLMPSIVSPSFF